MRRSTLCQVAAFFSVMACSAPRGVVAPSSQSKSPSAAQTVVDVDAMAATDEQAEATDASARCLDSPTDAVDRAKDLLGGGWQQVEALFPPPWTPSSRPDLNGDGKSDAIFPVPAGGYNDGYLLYVLDGQCARFLDYVPGQEVDALGTFSYGVRDIHAVDSAVCEGGCKCRPGEAVFRFDGHHYVVDPATQRKATAADCEDP